MIPPLDMNDQISQNEKFKMENDKSLIININDKNYIFSISANDDIVSFKINDLYLFPKKEYYYTSSFESLKDVNKYFLVFDNLDECVNTIIQNVEKKNIIFKINDNICEMVILNLITNKSFVITIPKIENVNNNVNQIISIIKELNTKVLTLENKNNFLEERIKKLEEENLKIKNEILFIKQLQNSNTNLFPNSNINLFPNSNIIINNEQSIILNFFEQKPKKFNLLYDTNKHGNKNKTFHEKVYNKSPTLIIIKTTNDLKFGGYTTKVWPNNNSYLKDKDAFIYSLNKKKKYNIIDENESAIYGCSNENSYMFVFGSGHDICVYNNCTEVNDNHVGKSEYNTTQEYELNNGMKNFTVSSLEVYEVEY